MPSFTTPALGSEYFMWQYFKQKGDKTDTCLVHKLNSTNILLQFKSLWVYMSVCMYVCVSGSVNGM